jgi:hypothetical protein
VIAGDVPNMKMAGLVGVSVCFKGNVAASNCGASLTILCQIFKSATFKLILIGDYRLTPRTIIAWRFGVIVVSKANENAAQASSFR